MSRAHTYKMRSNEWDYSEDGYDEGVDALADALHAELHLGAEAANIPQQDLNQTLVLLDCNGMLVHRTSDELPRNQRRWDYNVPTGYRRNYDNFFYIRPHARELVCCLLNDPRCEVAVYTSIMAKNVMPVIQGFDKYFQKMTAEGLFEPIVCSASTASTGYIDAYSSTLLDDSLGLFDQEYNISDPQGMNHWDTMRDLNKIWKARKVKAMGFGKHNTLIVDAEARKVRNWKHNSIVVQEYTRDRLLLDTRKETTLKILWEYLDETVLSKMQNKAIADNGGIQKIIREHPYRG